MNYFSKKTPVILLALAALGVSPGFSPSVVAQSGLSGAAKAAITKVEGTAVSLNVGAKSGLKVGANLPVLRGGNIVALVRVQTVSASSATGVVVWRDETAPLLSIGDVLGLGSAGEQSSGAGAPQLFETGVSNIGVATADKTYIYLASLAASGLITSQPAHVFNDEGAFHHRTAEDFTFSRAQIAGFIKEALDSPKAKVQSDRNDSALRALVAEYAKDLRRLGVDDERLAAFKGDTSFKFGVSGQVRASLTGGDDIPAFKLPFSEAAGGLRTRQGLEGRANLWAQSGKVSFLGSVDAGFDVLAGVNSRNYSVRRALLSYDAGKSLRGLTVNVGRDELWLGPGHFGTLALSDNAGPLNMIHAKLKRGSWVAEGVYAPLGKGPGGAERALYTKHLYLNVGQQTRVGVVESVVDSTGAFSGLKFLSTFSPLPLMVARTPDNKDVSNMLLQSYVETSVARGVRAYGELLIDDVSSNDNNILRNRLGVLLGAHVFTPKNPTKRGMFVEFANLNARTYLHHSPELPDYNYQHNGVPFGYPVAPLPGAPVGRSNLGGAESLRFESYWRPGPKWRLSSGLEFSDVNSELSQPTTPTSFSRQQIYRFRASYDWRPDTTLSARFVRVTTVHPTFAMGVPSLSQKLLSLEVAHAF